jgi:FkbM family methyltransferase
MSWRTTRLTLALRNLGRRSGVNQWLAAKVGTVDYEDRFRTRMLEEIRPGDCVWDVGANVGHYSSMFSGIVGPAGKVFAFEPSPTNLVRLTATVGSLNNVVLVPVALGETAGQMAFAEGIDATGATSRVIPNARAFTGPTVEVRRGDDLVRSAEAAAPNVIKIDTEGFELEVLRGIAETLRHPELRALGIEIHFAVLSDRGLAGAGAEIERMLEARGFRCEWPDPSHLVASRSAHDSPRVA